jgi:hypothetical protein
MVFLGKSACTLKRGQQNRGGGACMRKLGLMPAFSMRGRNKKGLSRNGEALFICSVVGMTEIEATLN